MRAWQVGLVIVLTAAGASVHAQTPAGTSAPAPTSFTCKDGTAITAASRRGACRGHGGIQTAAAGTPAATPVPATAPAAAAPATAPAPKPPAAAAVSRPASPASSAVVAQTPTNPTDVWVNTRSKVYHCPGTSFYGKTKVGSFMSEAAAKAAGDRPADKKTCTAAS